MKLALSSDHAGYAVAMMLKQQLAKDGHEVIYFGPDSFNPDDDYPDYMKPAAESVSNGQVEKGIILGGSGQGEAIVANRYKGVRCVVYYGPPPESSGLDIIVLSREHNDANMLSIGARFVSSGRSLELIRQWLTVPFSHDERHVRRINKIDG